MVEKARWHRRVLRAAASLLTLLLVTAMALAAAKYASVVRFSGDATLAPRAIYKEEAHRVAGAAFLIASKIGREEVYAGETVRTIGGVILQETAKPEASLAGKEIDLRYNKTLPDGHRLQIKIGGQQFKSNLFDWALIPISNYANSQNTAVISLLGSSHTTAEETFEQQQAIFFKRPIFWVQVHPALKDTLIGFNALLTDAMFLGGDPSRVRKYTERLKPKIVGWNSSGFIEQSSATASQKFSTLLSQAQWETYIFNDLDSAFTVATQGDMLVINGRNPTYHFFDDIANSAAPNKDLTEAIRNLGAAEFNSLNPAVYSTAYYTARWASFFRYMKHSQPEKWSSYLTSLDEATGVFAVETPVAWAPR